jgi:hypothetical protein
MSDLEDVLKKRLNQLGIKKQVEASLIVKAVQDDLKEIFGPETEQNLKVISYKKGLIKIAARTNAWANECQGSLDKIIKPPVERVVFSNFLAENIDGEI